MRTTFNLIVRILDFLTPRLPHIVSDSSTPADCLHAIIKQLNDSTISGSNGSGRGNNPDDTLFGHVYEVQLITNQRPTFIQFVVNYSLMCIHSK